MTLLTLEDISKRYPGVQALDAVTLAAAAGRVHALVGENGAGKSTLLRILAGAARPDAGHIAIDGHRAPLATPSDALAHGVTVVYQELTLVPKLSAAENIFLGMEPVRGLVLDRAAMHAESGRALGRLGVAIDPAAPVDQLAIAHQQLVEIARALVRRARVIALDEPTATLTTREVEHLFTQVRALAAEGVAVIFVSHRLDEVRELADDVTVLRDGRVVWTGEVGAVDDAGLIRLMVGRDVEYVRLPPARLPRGDPLLAVSGLTQSGSFHDVGFTVRRGEIVALAGLVGAGRTAVARCLAGADPWDEGTVTLDGTSFHPRSPRDAIARRLVYLPEDRKRDGLVLGFRVRENTTLATLRRYARAGVIQAERERRAAEEAVEGVQLRPPDTERTTATLSGGNQQKVVLARWLLADADVLIFDEPTRGVDVGSKVELHRQIRALADAGKAIVVISSELPEVLALADRIVVMREGRVTGELDGDGATAERVMALAVAA